MQLNTLKFLCSLMISFTLSNLQAEGDKSAVKEGSISLPSAGGSIQKEKGHFSSSAYNGAATFSFPIDLPSAGGHTKPPLTINYGSLSGNGPLGLGWQLSISKIALRLSQGVPTYKKNPDGSFVDEIEIDGTPLLFKQQQGEKLYYILEKSDTFQTVIYSKGEGWQVKKNDGSIYFYEERPCSTLSNIPVENCSMMESLPEGTKIASWYLTKITSLHRANTIKYKYTRPIMEEGAIQLLRLPHIQQISYGIHKIQFNIMASKRSDNVVNYKPGFRYGSFALFDSIEIKTGSLSVKQYCFIYEQGLGAGHSRFIYGQACKPGERGEIAHNKGLDNNPTIHTSTYLRKIVPLAGEKTLAVADLKYPSLNFRYSSWFKGDVESDRRKLIYPITNFKKAMMDPAAGINELIDINQDGLPDVLKKLIQWNLSLGNE